MNGRYFLDTNILVYSLDPSSPPKQDVAKELLRSAVRDGRGIISYKVVQEFCSVAARKFAQPLSQDDLQDYLRQVLAPLCEVHSSIRLFESALRLQSQTQYSFYDCLILAAAAQAGCDTVYSEDFQDGQTIAGVKIVNPF